MNKVFWLHLAEVIDSWRIVPRLFLMATFIWTVELSWYLLHWYTALPAPSRSIEASGFASIVFLAVLGFMKLVFDSYVSHGRTWDAPFDIDQKTTTTVASTTTRAVTPPT